MRSRSLYIFLVVLLSLCISNIVQAQQQETPIVRLIYFLPNDREPQLDIDAKLDTLIKDVQQFYADMMEFHGFERKTFQCETDASGNAVVHHVTGQFTDKYYSSLSSTWDIWREIEPRFDLSRNIYLTVIDMSNEYLDGTSGRYGQADVLHKRALVPFGKHLEENFGIAVTAHELGHAFGLMHDYRKNLELGIDIYTTDPMISSFCTAEWLDGHRAFNPSLLASNEPTSIKALPPSDSSDNAIHLRFEISDPDGLHQVQLLVLSGNFGLIDCKGLNGDSHRTVQFITTALTPEHKFVALNIIDGYGNILRSTNYPIDVTVLQSPDKVFSIPDPNLDAAVRRKIGLSPNEPLTRRNTLHLKSLVIDTEVIDFTGLEQASNLTRLSFHGDGIISDLSKLSRLTQLTFLQISGNNNISDVSPLTELTKLTRLYLSNNNISDVSPLAGLINLEYLKLESNLISDTSSLDGLVEHTIISWGGNPGFPRGGPKITGPWLWVIVPARSLHDDIDHLAITSEGETTELKIATNGAKEGMAIGNSRWTSHKISDRSNNINEMRESFGWEQGIVYGSIVLETSEQQQTIMFVGSDDAVKVWLNRQLIHQALVTRSAYDYQSFFDVTLKKGENVLLVAVDNRLGGTFTGFFGFAPDAEYTTALPPFPVPVTLSSFRAEHTDVGVVLKWTTESEIDNAGFYIYRSETRGGEFKVVNPNMIQGAGTTGERNEYTWIDTTTKSNTVYYYRIEDVSHAGVREQLATVRLRGLVVRQW